MNVTLGAASIAFGLAASLIGAGTVATGLYTGNARLLNQARTYTWGVVLAAIVGVVVMERALITRDFTVAFVADNGSSRTDAIFNVATLWSALEGSILVWVLVLAGYMGLVVWKFGHRLDDPLVGWAMLVLFVVAGFFYLLMFGPAQPFERFDPPPGFDGPGPNPLLQNHILMAFHPPILYLGYVGFTVPFAFAIAALATGRLGEGWLLETRRWTLASWGFLTVGIALGAWWSYEVLGWGGYWGWDPVENASLLPWLTGTAYLHSVMVQERRGLLRVWNLSLVCATFSLTILGTFITRSGVIDSVHAFTEGGVGPMLLGFFALVVVVTVGLIGWRGDLLRSPGRVDSPISREGAFLANNVVFGAFAFVVLLGTIWPLIIEAIDGDRISVGAPFFDDMTMPIGFVLLFLMAVAPVLPWRSSNVEVLSDRLLWPAWLGAAAMVFAVIAGARGWEPLLAFGLAGWAGGAALRQIVLATRRQGWRGFVGRANGGMIVHLGVIMVAVGLAASSSFVRQNEFSFTEVGQTATVSGHEVEYLGIEVVEYDERTATEVSIRIDGDEIHKPALSFYPLVGQNVGTPSTAVSPWDDVQVALLRLPDDPGDPTVVRVTVQPLVSWLWFGAAVMAFGTLLAAFPGKRRRPTMPTSAPVPGVPGSRKSDDPATSDESADEPVVGSVG